MIICCCDCSILFFYVFFSPSVALFVSRSLSLFYLKVSVYLSFCVFISPCVSVSLTPSISICLSACLLSPSAPLSVFLHLQFCSSFFLLSVWFSTSSQSYRTVLSVSFSLPNSFALFLFVIHFDITVQFDLTVLWAGHQALLWLVPCAACHGDWVGFWQLRHVTNGLITYKWVDIECVCACVWWWSCVQNVHPEWQWEIKREKKTCRRIRVLNALTD